jgi:hypothetical protein
MILGWVLVVKYNGKKVGILENEMLWTILDQFV